MIWESLIVSPVLWVLSSNNTLSVTHSDTALPHTMVNGVPREVPRLRDLQRDSIHHVIPKAFPHNVILLSSQTSKIRFILAKGLPRSVSGAKKDATFTLRHIVTECYMILAIFWDFWERLKNIFKMQRSKHVLHFRWRCFNG